MAKIEDRIYSAYSRIQRLFTNEDDVLLGVCANISRRLNMPVVVPRILGLVAFFFWPIITAVVYVVLGAVLSEVSEQ